MKWLKEFISLNIKINLETFIENESFSYPLLSELINTEQDPIWHSEGNVHIHTNMVIDELYKIIESDKYKLNDSDKFILIMSAVFHDIGKPKTSKWKTIKNVEHLTASGHENFGMSYLSYKLLNEDLTTKEYQSILDLVGYHQKPKLLVVKNETTQWDYKLLTENTSGLLFYILELADMKGRECIDKKEQIQYIELFKLFSIEYNCFYSESNIDKELETLFKTHFNEQNEKSLNYLIGKAKSRLYHKDIIDPIIIYQKYYEHKNNHPTIFLMCGISGSGKSTTSKKIYQNENIHSIIELDELRKKYKQKNNNRREIDGKIRQESKEILKKALANKENIIFDSCNHRMDFRNFIFSIAEEYHAKTVLVHIKTPIEQCIKNDKTRNRIVGDSVIIKQAELFQHPLKYESNHIF